MEARGAVAFMTEAADILARLDVLATCSDDAGAITRLFLSPAHARAVVLVREWMLQAGLRCRLDASGTLVGSLRSATPDAPVLMVGSHIDTVRNAGRYDGCLGVAVAIAAAARMSRRRVALPYTLEIRAFGDEEGVRFPVTLTGAHAAAGHFHAAWLGVEDAQGTSLSQALRAFGLDPEALASGDCTAAGSFAYLEVHIEQGPVLEAAGAPLGIVTAINGAARFEICLTGRAGHAGTVPMAGRQDALVAAAHMVLAVRKVGVSRPGVVATVGRLAVTPDAANVIPGGCIFSIDVRASDDGERGSAEREIRQRLEQLAQAHGVRLSVARTHEAPAVVCDERLQAALARGLQACGLPLLHLPSGAGHDGMAVAALCPVGMLFVRCAGGISHHPDESVSEADVAHSLDVLTHALLHLRPGEFCAV
jgi:allantoate deiminase